MTRKSLILFFVLIYAISAFSSHAQTQNNRDVTLEINPQYPRMNDNATASLSSYSINLDKAKISWLLNGKLGIEDIGKKDFSFKVGGAGEETTIEAQIMTSDGLIIDKNTVITPTDIDMIWEAKDSYVPPFYEGKAIAPSEGNIKVVAMPSSSTNEKYIYSWKQDDNNEPDSSGYGKNFYSFQNSFLETSNTVEVKVSDILGNDLGTGQITMQTGNPEILFYEKDLNLGTKWEKSLDDGFTISPNGSTIVAEPYFFSPKDLNSSDLQFKWSLGDSDINTPTIPNEISIKPESGQSGSSTISLSIQNINRLFLSMVKTLSVNF